MAKGKGWHGEKQRHSLAARGIKTARQISYKANRDKPSKQDLYEAMSASQNELYDSTESAYDKLESYINIIDDVHGSIDNMYRAAERGSPQAIKNREEYEERLSYAVNRIQESEIDLPRELIVGFEDRLDIEYPKAGKAVSNGYSTINNYSPKTKPWTKNKENREKKRIKW